MIFVIFTKDGLAQAETEVITEKATLWLNPSLIEESDLSRLKAADIAIHALPEQVDNINEKAVMAALNHVESQSPKTEILVEYI